MLCDRMDSTARNVLISIMMDNISEDTADEAVIHCIWSD